MTQPIVKKGYVDLSNGQQVHYRYVKPATESQDTPIVYLHKSASSSVSYEKLMIHYVQQGYSGYAFDMPGFGQSFDPTNQQITEIQRDGTKWFAGIFLTAFEQLGITSSKFHIIGHHSGASLATQLASNHPELVASICQIGATTIGHEERQRMKEKFMKPFNQPVKDGSHLMKTWEYLGNMGLAGDLDLRQREVIDHVRAWKGRMLIYGAVWDQDSEVLFAKIKCPILVLCARDDVLWDHMENVKKVNPAAKTGEVGGANFSLDLDVSGIIREWDAFQAKAS